MGKFLFATVMFLSFSAFAQNGDTANCMKKGKITYCSTGQSAKTHEGCIKLKKIVWCPLASEGSTSEKRRRCLDGCCDNTCKTWGSCGICVPF